MLSSPLCRRGHEGARVYARISVATFLRQDGIHRSACKRQTQKIYATEICRWALDFNQGSNRWNENPHRSLILIWLSCTAEGSGFSNVIFQWSNYFFYMYLQRVNVMLLFSEVCASPMTCIFWYLHWIWIHDRHGNKYIDPKNTSGRQ